MIQPRPSPSGIVICIFVEIVQLIGWCINIRVGFHRKNRGTLTPYTAPLERWGGGMAFYFPPKKNGGWMEDSNFLIVKEWKSQVLNSVCKLGGVVVSRNPCSIRGHEIWHQPKLPVRFVWRIYQQHLIASSLTLPKKACKFHDPCPFGTVLEKIPQWVLGVTKTVVKRVQDGPRHQ